MSSMTVTSARHAYRAVNGVFCVYKESGVSMRSLRQTLLLNITKDLNSMEGGDVSLGKVIRLIETDGDTVVPSSSAGVRARMASSRHVPLGTNCNTSLPGSHVTGIGSHMSGTDSDMSVTGSHMSGTGSGLPVTSSSVSATGSDTSVTGSDVTVPGSDVSVPCSNTSVTGSDVTVPGSDVSVTGSSTSVTGSDVTVPGSDTSVPGSNTSVPGSDRSVPGSEQQQQQQAHSEQCDMIALAAAADSSEYGLYPADEVKILRQVDIPPSDGGPSRRVMSVVSVPDLADHPLVSGPAYEPEDFTMMFVDGLTPLASGVVVVGVNARGCAHIRRLRRCKHVSVFRVSGALGSATHNYHVSGRVRYQTTYRHVTRHMVERVCARIQGVHQKAMFDYGGVDIQSEEAYQLASRGLIRPRVSGEPLLYGVRLVRFEPPHFTLEVHAINAYCGYLMNIIHEVGTLVKSSAACDALRRVQCGHFTVGHTLLRHQLTLQQIIYNMTQCRSIVDMDTVEHSARLEPMCDTAGALSKVRG